MDVDLTYLRIKRVIASDEECFLCALEDEIERKYMDTYLSELVMDASSRQKIVEAGVSVITTPTECSLQQTSREARMVTG